MTGLSRPGGGGTPRLPVGALGSIVWLIAAVVAMYIVPGIRTHFFDRLITISSTLPTAGGVGALLALHDSRRSWMRLRHGYYFCRSVS